MAAADLSQLHMSCCVEGGMTWPFRFLCLAPPVSCRMLAFIFSCLQQRHPTQSTPVHTPWMIEYDGGSCSLTSDEGFANSDHASTHSADRTSDAIDEMMEHHADLAHEYAQMFCFEDSEFRRKFEDDFDDELSWHPLDYRNLLSEEADQAPMNHVGALSVNEEGPLPSVAVPAAALPGSALVTSEQLGDGTVIRVKESPATKKLKNNETIGIVFDIDSEMNRKQLQETYLDHPVISPLVSAESFFVGYRNRASVCQGLVVLEGPNREQRAVAIVSSIPSARRMTAPPTHDELRPFYREEFIKPTRPLAATALNEDQAIGEAPLRANHAITAASMPSPRKATALLSASMHDTERLRHLIRKHGGVQGCRFVAFDCEAAIVSRGAVPLPLEIAFVDCLEPNRPETNFHAFVHPGSITDDEERTAQMLSLTAVPGGHGIPYKCARFLSNNYIRLVGEMNQIWKNGGEGNNVILINKGSCMDVQAIRWIYAAAQMQVETVEDCRAMDVCVPTILDVPMFDIETLREVLFGESEGDAVQRGSIKTLLGHEKACAGRCWYHGEMGDVFESAHCAKLDARALAGVVRRWLTGTPVVPQ